MPDIKNDIVLTTKLAAFSGMIAAVTGQAPQIKYGEDYAEIVFNENQKAILQNYIENALKAKPGKVRIDYGSITYPPLFRVYGKYALMLVVAAFLLGNLTAPK